MKKKEKQTVGDSIRQASAAYKKTTRALAAAAKTVVRAGGTLEEFLYLVTKNSEEGWRPNFQEVKEIFEAEQRVQRDEASNN